MDSAFPIKYGVSIFVPTLSSAHCSPRLYAVEFDAEKVEDVEWNEDAFDNLVLPADRKHLLQSLVEAHHQELGFDDFIKGKGHGLVINLFGPPGVGTFRSSVYTGEA